MIQKAEGRRDLGMSEFFCPCVAVSVADKVTFWLGFIMGRYLGGANNITLRLFCGTS